ncbi:MAG: ATP-grasp domain-containing protein [Chitinophagales bacterium]|nr:ATP-grasp domain-containing protein [Chitinophagales bacterium]
MEIMGSKLAAKEAVAKYNTPLVPGTEEAITDIAAAKKRANEIGFPILIKASAGGGGKGMRIVENEAEFEEQMNRAISEAVSAFGDGSVFIEKFVKGPRHIEIQILADAHGNTLYLQERECSIQRRHQKVIEEAPSCVLTPQLRKKMGEDAVNVARSCHYVGAGTVEFLLDEDMNYYFLEMNTRLQVEHPVTEMITGIDLVKEQVKVARGEKLAYKQEDIGINGHAIELRVYAEDPQNNFLPDIGKLEIYKKPEGPGVRVDDGFEEGMDIPIYYDPMISKLIVHAENREAALNRMKRAIDEYHIKGVKNTLAFGKYVMNHKAFISGKFDTNFVKNHFKPEDLDKENKDEMEVAAILAAHLFKKSEKVTQANGLNQTEAKSKWLTKRKTY